MGRRIEQRRRNVRTLKARNACWDEFSSWVAAERLVRGDPKVTARRGATQLVIDTGDLLLELLTATATESVDRPRSVKRRDAKELCRALADTAAVHRTWIFLTYAVAAREAARVSEVDDLRSEEVHRDVAQLVSAYWPLSVDEERAIELGFSAESQGYWSLEWVYTHQAFSLLIGDRVAELGLFVDLEPLLDLRLLQIAWNHGADHYAVFLEEMARPT